MTQLTEFLELAGQGRQKRGERADADKVAEHSAPCHFSGGDCYHAMHRVSHSFLLWPCLPCCSVIEIYLYFVSWQKPPKRKGSTQPHLTLIFPRFFFFFLVRHISIKLNFFLMFSATWMTAILLHLGNTMRLGQSLADCGLQAKWSPSLTFANHIFLEQSHTHLLTYQSCCSLAVMAMSGRCYWDRVVHKGRKDLLPAP